MTDGSDCPRSARARRLSTLGVTLVALAIAPGVARSQLVASQASAATGPFDIALFPTTIAPAARAHARLVYAHSPFGVAVTPDGRARYDVQIDAAGLPAARALGDGAFRAYVAWAVSTDLSQWHRLGAVVNGSVTVGQADLNKFLLVITAERDSTPETRGGPVVLRGSSPSSWLQTFLTHPMFRGVSP